MPHPLTICVFCSSSSNIARPFFVAADELGTQMAERGHQLVYGGASVGLMGAIARATTTHGGRVIGVIPEALKDREVAYEDADELILTRDLRQRKAIMEVRSDAFIALPGGFGTLEETIELLTLKQIGLHHKPIVILNVDRFYDPLLRFFEHIEETGFAPLGGHMLYSVVTTPAEALAIVERDARPLPPDPEV